MTPLVFKRVSACRYRGKYSGRVPHVLVVET